MFGAAEDVALPVRRWIADEPGVLDAAKEGLERDVDLQPRERTAKAGVDAAPPAKVLVVLACGVEGVWVGESERVAVRSAVHEVDRRTFRDDGAADLDVVSSGPAGEELNRRLHAQGFL